MKRNNRILLPILLSFTTFFLTLFPAALNASSNTENQLVTIHSDDKDGVEFSLHTPRYELEIDGRVKIAGLPTLSHSPGAPMLPFYTTFVALPPGADVNITVHEKNITTNRVDSVAVSPKASPVYQEDGIGTGLIEDLELGYIADRSIYEIDEYYPKQAYTLSEPMYARDLRVVRVTLHPLQYNPVAQQMRHVGDIEVSLTFSGADTQSVRTIDKSLSNPMSGQVLNKKQAEEWRGLPTNLHAAKISLPLDRPTYKIEVDQDGIYKVTYADLILAGMPVTGINPHTFEMMYRGEPVSYELVADKDEEFEPGEYILFFGWKFDGPRSERVRTKTNIYWLWADGVPDIIADGTNSVGYTPVDSFISSITAETDWVFFSTWSNQWSTFENEADAWYWHYFSAADTIFDIQLPHPAASGDDARFTAEILSGVFNPTTSVDVYMNAHATPASRTWTGKFNFNVIGTAPITTVQELTNTIRIVFSPLRQYLLLNRITVDYPRLLIADDEQLLFSHELTGTHEFNVQGYGEGNADNVIAWDLTDRLNPVRIPMSVSDVSGSGPYTYRIASDHVAGAQFIATTVGNVRPPITVSRYDGVDLTPLGERVDWLAITHADFMTETRRLEAHRADPIFSGLRTHVVDVEDVFNQYGHGFRFPEAIRAYLLDGMASWTVPPSYVALVGDGTSDVRNIKEPQPDFMPTYLEFIDRFQGMIPTDHPFMMLVGSDTIPDLAVGRLTAASEEQITAIVDKIIKYENNLLTPDEWMTNNLFVADNADAGGDFCAESQYTGNYIHDSINKPFLCLPETNTLADREQLKADMFAQINVTGTLFLNYRGHGGITGWGAGINVNDVDLWTNVDRPVVLLSADCLDGHFTWIKKPALSETFLRKSGGGTAAHWSSTGLGYSFEHTVLHVGFYEALFDFGLTAIGDAILSAKEYYVNIGYHESEMFAFTLQGDPAMQLLRPDLSLQKSSVEAFAAPSHFLHFRFEVINNGLYPSTVTLTDTLPSGVNYESYSSSVPLTVTVTGNDVIFELVSPLAWGETAVITMTTRLSSGFVGSSVFNSAIVGGTGLEMAPGDEVSSVLVPVSVPTSVTLSRFGADNQLYWEVGGLLLLIGFVMFIWIYRKRPLRLY